MVPAPPAQEAQHHESYINTKAWDTQARTTYSYINVETKITLSMLRQCDMSEACLKTEQALLDKEVVIYWLQILQVSV
jgi:hypothetical protein